MIGLLVVLFILFVVVFLVWPALVAGASGRRRNMENAWMYGAALSWVPQPAPTLNPYRAGAPPTRTCPRCAETVEAAASTCRFCGHGFGAPSS